MSYNEDGHYIPVCCESIHPHIHCVECTGEFNEPGRYMHFEEPLNGSGLCYDCWAMLSVQAGWVRSPSGIPNVASWDYRPYYFSRRRPIPLAMRARVFWRDSYRCLCCHSRESLTVDHIIPLVCGGTDTLDNFQTLCRRCNSAKGDSIADLRENRMSI